MNVRNRLAIAVCVLALATGACGSSSHPRTQGGAATCAPQTVAATTGPTVLTSAMLQSAVIRVAGAATSHPTCAALSSGSTVSLQIGDAVEFEANSVPQLATDVVRVSSRPGPSSSFGGLKTSHVIVRLTATRAGTVTVRWVDCSGTGC